MPKAYTVVLVETPSGTLLINRRKPPYIGLWNALGGKIEPGETPAACAVREVHEESGIHLLQVQDCGVVHWFVDNQLRGDLYLFAGAGALATPGPAMTREGLLATWPHDWVHAPENLGLVPDLPAMLPLFAAGRPGEYTSHFEGARFLGLRHA